MNFRVAGWGRVLAAPSFWAPVNRVRIITELAQLSPYSRAPTPPSVPSVLAWELRLYQRAHGSFAWESAGFFNLTSCSSRKGSQAQNLELAFLGRVCGDRCTVLLKRRPALHAHRLLGESVLRNASDTDTLHDWQIWQIFGPESLSSLGLKPQLAAYLVGNESMYRLL